MIRMYRLSPWTLLLSFVAFASLLFVSLPIVLILLSVFLISGALRTLLGNRKPKRSRFEQNAQDPNVSSVIKNEKIGPYRIKANPRDPNVIEVLD